MDIINLIRQIQIGNGGLNLCPAVGYSDSLFETLLDVLTSAEVYFSAFQR
jgi:hypothetical protein